MRRLSALLPRHPLARHMAILIVVKIALIVAIYHAFFDGRQVETSSDSVAERLFAPDLPNPAQPTRSPDHAD